MKFSELGLDQGVMDALEYMNYGQCTPVQEQAIPPVLNGDDVIAVAQTGTGKTAAYLLPILSNLNRYRYPTDAINCVIMAPTRELAQQIDQQMQGFSYFVDASSVAVYGGGEGTDFAAQERGLRQGADVVIATPGRLISHINLGYVDLSQVSFFVLDEADRMLDMGFYDDIMAINKLLPDDCQKILYSATMPPKIQRLAENILWNPVMVKIAISKPAEKIHQQCCICHEAQKAPMLIRFLKKFYGGREDGFVKDELLHNPEKRVVVFVSRKADVRDVVMALRKKGFQVAAMHSDLEQKDRDEVMNAFRAGITNVIVATDIVSRGIDISGIALVVNYDMPHDLEDYVHRIGRTARADHDGESLTLVSCDDRRDMRKLDALEKFIDKKMERIPVPEELGGCDVKDTNPRDHKSTSPRDHKTTRQRNNKTIHKKTNDNRNEDKNSSHRTGGRFARKHRPADRPTDTGSTSPSAASDLPTA
ncbi:MAG: DEAD/DEAH box helicase [Bacteroidales bacterium]|nr:DEAD/DEAH box helicase [Bacteroidales bacterium]